MSRPRSVLPRLAALAALLAAATACASGGGASGGPGGLAAPEVGAARRGDAVTGEVSVSWRNLNPKYPAAVNTLVNASSEQGRLLRSGRASSSETRVIDDVEMGTLLDKMTELDYFSLATPGLSEDNLPNVPGRRGVVLVRKGGQTWGLMLSPGAGGTDLPECYRDCKGLILALHGAVQGLEVQVGVDEKVFSAPPIRMQR